MQLAVAIILATFATFLLWMSRRSLPTIMMILVMVFAFASGVLQWCGNMLRWCEAI
jgi:hypothetical protein